MPQAIFIVHTQSQRPSSGYAKRSQRRNLLPFKQKIAKWHHEGLCVDAILGLLGAQTSGDLRPSRAQLVNQMHAWDLRRYRMTPQQRSNSRSQLSFQPIPSVPASIILDTEQQGLPKFSFVEWAVKRSAAASTISACDCVVSSATILTVRDRWLNMVTKNLQQGNVQYSLLFYIFGLAVIDSLAAAFKAAQLHLDAAASLIKSATFRSNEFPTSRPVLSHLFVSLESYISTFGVTEGRFGLVSCREFPTSQGQNETVSKSWEPSDFTFWTTLTGEFMWAPVNLPVVQAQKMYQSSDVSLHVTPGDSSVLLDTQMDGMVSGLDGGVLDMQTSVLTRCVCCSEKGSLRQVTMDFANMGIA